MLNCLLTHDYFLSQTKRVVVALACMGIVVFWAASVSADTDDPVESARDAFERSGSLPWYDSDEDELRRVEVRSPTEPPTPPNVKGQQAQQQGTPGVGWFAGLMGEILFYIACSLIGLLIVGLIVLAIYTVVARSDQGEWELPDDTNQITSDADRIEQLPIPLKRNLSDLLGEARRHYEAGNFNEAIIYLYSYLLVELDKAQLIRLLRGKTNRQYLRELQDAPPTLGSLMERTMIAFEDAFFGNYRLEKARFEECYQQLDEFHHHLEPSVV